MSNLPTIVSNSRELDQVKALVLDSLDSEHSRRAYSRALDDFFAWHKDAGRPTLTKAVLQTWRARLIDQGLAASTINQRLTSVRRLVKEAADNGLVPDHLAVSVMQVEGVKAGGNRTGNWLTLDQARELFSVPDISTVRGARDKAILISSDISPHDLRRTFSKLARKAGAELEQIMLSLGHESVATTQKYLGVDLNFENAPSDRIKL